MSAELLEENLLLPYERMIFRSGWKDYFKVKRECWLATIRRFPELWSLFLRLDEILLRGFDDCEQLKDLDKMLPLLLFIKSHQSMRVAAELGFSTHLTQAHDSTRGAIESAVIGHKIYREPMLAEVFFCKDDGKAELEKFNDNFIRHKKDNLFPNHLPFLAELGEIHSFLSETATHTTVSSLARHYTESDDDLYHYKKVTYTETDPEKIAMSLYYMISAFSCTEKAFYDAFSPRLKLDDKLQGMRGRFEAEMKTVAKAVVRKFEIQGPLIVRP